MKARWLHFLLVSNGQTDTLGLLPYCQSMLTLSPMSTPLSHTPYFLDVVCTCTWHDTAWPIKRLATVSHPIGSKERFLSAGEIITLLLDWCITLLTQKYDEIINACFCFAMGIKSKPRNNRNDHVYIANSLKKKRSSNALQGTRWGSGVGWGCIHKTWNKANA